MTTDSPDLAAQLFAEFYHFSLPSLPHWIEPAVDHLRQRAIISAVCQESRAAKLTVALHEALTNAIIHGNLELSSTLKEEGDNAFAQALARRVADPGLTKRLVDVKFDYDGERGRWVVTDEGPGFDIDKVLKRCLSDDPEVLLASGRGILLMKSFLDEVKYELGGRRLILALKRESGAEKRRLGRVNVHQPLQVVPVLPDGSVDWQAAYEAVSRNLSEGGVGVLQEKLGQIGRVLIGIMTDGKMVYVPAEVRRCQTLAGSMVELGCQFQLPSDRPETITTDPQQRALHEAIADLLRRRKHQQVSDDERRVQTRVVYNEKIEVALDDGTLLTAYARDLSKGGLAFLATKLVPLESVRVSLPQAEGEPVGVRCRIVRCHKIREGLYDVGARFVELS